MITRPAPGVLTGYAVGAAVALFPNQLPRSAAVAAAVALLFGLVGALIGRAVARRRGVAPSYRCALYVLPAALVGWLLWQNHLRAAAGVTEVGVVEFTALAAVLGAAPFASSCTRPPRW
ncbi:hypothetical protein [Tsukamurella sp. PLM1]|uniref:hypothetical protein n=1 Tax=Tsukamurella sp. PLM1 TaxID=2929795 RepID=UPI00205DCF05|nr:hypothetical protein [Tsukamurella sp. PLM1]BDH58410.1 hypothetical protein MTP03_33490 [Tsukamurella sp. PLM1]